MNIIYFYISYTFSLLHLFHFKLFIHENQKLLLFFIQYFLLIVILVYSHLQSTNLNQLLNCIILTKLELNESIISIYEILFQFY